jgi:hypothetical protein
MLCLIPYIGGNGRYIPLNESYCLPATETGAQGDAISRNIAEGPFGVLLDAALGDANGEAEEAASNDGSSLHFDKFEKHDPKVIRGWSGKDCDPNVDVSLLMAKDKQPRGLGTFYSWRYTAVKTNGSQLVS